MFKSAKLNEAYRKQLKAWVKQEEQRLGEDRLTEQELKDFKADIARSYQIQPNKQ